MYCPKNKSQLRSTVHEKVGSGEGGVTIAYLHFVKTNIEN